jgi:hypothetical protein
MWFLVVAILDAFLALATASAGIILLHLTRNELAKSTQPDDFGIGMIAGGGSLVLLVLSALIAAASLVCALLYRRAKNGRHSPLWARACLLVASMPVGLFLILIAAGAVRMLR